MNTAVRIAAVAAGLFVLLELTARVHLFGIAGLVPAKMNSVHGLNQTGFTRQAGDARIGFELKPNLDGYFKLASFRTNSKGLRDREYTLEKPSDTFRVAVMGSSFALPAGVEIERAFHSLLEEQLSAEFAPRRYEFINFAVGMHGAEQILAMLELRALPYDPDLILICATRLSIPLLVKNPKRSAGKIPVSPLEFQVSYPVFQSFLARLIELRIGKESEPGRHVGVVEQFVMDAMLSAGSIEAATAFAPLPPPRASALERLGRIRADTGIPIVLVWLEFESTRPAPTVSPEARLRRHGLHYLDTRDAFRDTRPSDYWVNALDPHPNDRAHAIFARVIADFLRSNALIPSEDPQASSARDASRALVAPLQ